MHMKRKLLIVSIIIFTGCASFNFYKKIDTAILSGNYTEADQIIEQEKKSYAGEHELLYYFDKGMILHMLGDYDASTEYLNNAELKIESLYTKSITKEVSSYFTNDMSLPYEGEDFEQVMVNIIKCLNFMYKGDFDGALVEARKVDHRLNLLSDRYEGKNIYKEDAFARYLSAIAYEANGEMNDAFIAYKKALKAYNNYQKLYGTSVPRSLKSELLRAADGIKFYDEIEEFEKEWGEKISFEKYNNFMQKGEVIFIIYDGMAPYKVSKYVEFPVKEKDKVAYYVKVAFPKFVARENVISGAQITINGVSYNSYVTEDVNSIAIKTLENKNFLIEAKAIARAITKYQMTRAVSNDGKNQLAQLTANIINTATEQADTRSWRTLPGRFHMLRIALPPGKRELKLSLNSIRGGVKEQTFNVEIKAGKKKIIPVFCFN
ncbi:MAG: hypothetical protein KA120_08430 [Candidatus Goldbacteria bacterium]|nr:hypothetical protein [Candidatus Goldiibacteriota bacterium]